MEDAHDAIERRGSLEMTTSEKGAAFQIMMALGDLNALSACPVGERERNENLSQHASLSLFGAALCRA